MSGTVLTGSDRNKVIIKMLSVVLLCVAALSLPAHAQPVSCREDAQCSNGHYCETDARICRECLSCEDLKREPPQVPKTCIKSVAECGACINELVVDSRSGGDVNTQCVKPDGSSYEGTPSYVWPLIGIGVLLFSLLVIGIIVYLLRNPEIFKAAGSNQSSTVTARITTATPTAPEAPPPPYQPPSYTYVEPTAYEEEHLIKPPPTRPQDTLQTAGNQAARVYNEPIYVRDPTVPSAESPVPEYTESEMTFHDEDTVPSTWGPGGPTSNGDVNANVVSPNTASSEAGADATAGAGAGADAGAGVMVPALLAAARETTLVEHSASKKRCLRQDSRDSNCGDTSNNNYPRSPSPSQGGPPYSFITQITNVVQINTNK